MLYENLEKIIEDSYDETVKLRRYLHMNPELSFQEEHTREYILKKLKEYGYSDIKENVGGNGILATYDSQNEGPIIGLRADFDALPIQEETDLEFRSQKDGVMHACGHDVHTAILLSVAKAVKASTDPLYGKIIFIFQHAEELPPGGAKAIVASGELSEIDYIYGLHVHGNDKFDGKINYCSGYAMAASDNFEIKIQGAGGHGSAPHMTTDSTVVAAFLIQQLQTIISRKKDPSESGVLTIAIFKSGEGAHNIIADTATLKGTVRTLNPEVQALVESEMRKMTALICEAHGAKATVSYEKGYPAVFNHKEPTELVKNLFEKKFGAGQAEAVAPAMGGEDFAYYLEEKPGTFFYVPAGIPEQEINYPHHHSKFTVDERSMLVGAKAFSLIIDHYLSGAKTEGSDTDKKAGEYA